MTDDDKRVVREALERVCAEEGVDLRTIEDYAKVASMLGFRDLAQSRWVRVLWRLLQESKPSV